jgi:hypothetical protein
VEDVAIREIDDGDSFEELTELLHRAYAPLAAAGFRYLATHQDDAPSGFQGRVLRRLRGGTACRYHRAPTCQRRVRQLPLET